jgi:hypothetical protein
VLYAGADPGPLRGFPGWDTGKPQCSPCWLAARPGTGERVHGDGLALDDAYARARAKPEPTRVRMPFGEPAWLVTAARVAPRTADDTDPGAADTAEGVLRWLGV